MTYRAHIRNGVAVLDDAVTLGEGTAVLIEPIETTAAAGKAGSIAELLRDVAGKGQGLPADGSTQHDHYIYGSPKR
jgi:hypothetical protein